LEIWKRIALSVVWFLVAVVVIAAFAFGLYRLANIAVSSIPATVISIFVTALVAFLFQRRQEIEAARRQRKIEAYSGFMSIIFSDIVSPIHKAREMGKQPKINSADITDKIHGISAQIGLWAGNDVLVQYSNLLNGFIKPGNTDPARTIFDVIGDMILIFRKDLGYPPRKLTARDLYPLFGVPRDYVPKPTEAQGVESGSDAGTEPVAQLSVPPAPIRRLSPSQPRRRSRRRPS
jgi:hypothetical protein